MTETTPSQKIFLAMSLTVFTSMIIFFYGFQKPRLVAMQQAQMNKLDQLQDTLEQRNAETNVPASLKNKTTKVVYLSEENYYIKQMLDTHSDSSSGLKVSYKQAKKGFCEHPMCFLNKDRAEPENRQNPSEYCPTLEDCVTVVIKTANRLKNTHRLVTSLLSYFPNMYIIVIDNIGYSFQSNKDWNDLIANKQTIKYIQGLEGMPGGRNLGVRLSKTPYVLILDDDYVFTATTNLKKMLNVLQMTDVSVVGGTVGIPWNFEGALKLFTGFLDSEEQAVTHLRHYPAVYYEAIPGFVNCYMVDVVKNFLLLRRDDILKTEGWDSKRPVLDFIDFFTTLRLNRIKVAYCPGIVIEHISLEESMVTERVKLIPTYRQTFMDKWNLTSFNACSRDSYLSFSPHCTAM